MAQSQASGFPVTTALEFPGMAAEHADEAASAVAGLSPLDLASSGSSQGRTAGGRRRYA